MLHIFFQRQFKALVDFSFDDELEIMESGGYVRVLEHELILVARRDNIHYKVNILR